MVGAIGEHRKCGILTPEFSWLWVDREMDTFSSRPQDPYEMTDEQRKFMREKVFPYWKGKSLEEAFLARLPEDTKHIGVDTGVIDSDSKWRQAVGEITPDYQDVLFKKGFGGLIRQAEEKMAELDMANPEDEEKRDFYESTLWTSRGIIRYANRYADEAERMAGEEADPKRAEELRVIAKNCRRVPENPPESFYEAIQFLWFVQIGAILSENPLALNPGRFDQYMDPYYEADLAKGTITEDFAQELIEALWLKYSEWVWTISSNTADYFAGYNQFQNLTVGGRTRDGKDAHQPVSYMALKATEEVKSHQPGLSVRIHADCPKEFLDAVTHLVSKGTGFPAIHSDSVGYQMLINLGYEPDDARDWNNCGCVVPHFRKTGEWTSAANLNFGSALEYRPQPGPFADHRRDDGASTRSPPPSSAPMKRWRAPSSASSTTSAARCHQPAHRPASAQGDGAAALPLELQRALHGGRQGPQPGRREVQRGPRHHRHRPRRRGQLAGRGEEAGVRGQGLHHGYARQGPAGQLGGL